MINKTKIVSVGVRAATAGVSLATVTATYKILSPADFTLFNLVVFFLALGSAVSAPINRAFWAKDSIRNYASATISAMFLTALVLGMGILFSGVRPFVVSVTVVAAGCLYALCRTFERFSYARILIEQEFSRALLVSFLFAVSEGCVVALMWTVKLDSILVRLVLPVILFSVFLVFVPHYRILMKDIVFSIPKISINYRYLKDNMLSKAAVGVLVLMALATFAGMVDRLFLAHFPIGTVQETADYLLVLSYAIALQTLMTIFFDLSRKHVFYNDCWQAGARAFVVTVLEWLVVISAAAFVTYPIHIRLGILPASITIGMWGALLLRSLTLLLITIFNVDHFQSGRAERLLMPNMVVLSGVVASLWMLANGNQALAIGTLVLVCLCTVAGTAAAFFRRMPAS